MWIEMDSSFPTIYTRSVNNAPLPAINSWALCVEIDLGGGARSMAPSRTQQRVLRLPRPNNQGHICFQICLKNSGASFIINMHIYNYKMNMLSMQLRRCTKACHPSWMPPRHVYACENARYFQRQP